MKVTRWVDWKSLTSPRVECWESQGVFILKGIPMVTSLKGLWFVKKAKSWDSCHVKVWNMLIVMIKKISFNHFRCRVRKGRPLRPRRQHALDGCLQRIKRLRMYAGRLRCEFVSSLLRAYSLDPRLTVFVTLVYMSKKMFALYCWAW